MEATEHITISQLCVSCGGTLHGGGNPHDVVDKLATDSRSVASAAQGCAFFALHTRNNDGHRYITHLFERGVRCFVVEQGAAIDRQVQREACLIVVDNTLEALQRLAAWHRKSLDGTTVLAITGSTGKTTVKEWLYQMLWDRWSIARSPRSYNSQIGVPLSLWNIRPQHQLAIIEAGISKTGEMERQNSIISPTVGIITSLGHEHDEGFASMQEKAAEKAALLKGCEIAVYCRDSEMLTNEARKAAPNARHITWSLNNHPEANIKIRILGHDADGMDLSVDDGMPYTARVPITLPEMLPSVAAAIATATALNLSHSEITKRAARLTSVDTHITVTQGLYESMVFVDSYPSDYTTLGPALDFMGRYDSSTRRDAVVLTDLINDGSTTDEELYQRLAALLDNAHVELLVGIGPAMTRFKQLFTTPQKMFFNTVEECAEALTPHTFERCSVMMKGTPDRPLAELARMLEARRHKTVEEINLTALAANFRFFKSLLKPDTLTVAMVKASGYGTGSYEVAKTLVETGASFLAVAAQDEGVSLRRDGINARIIVLNPAHDHFTEIFDYGLEPEIYSLDECRQMLKELAAHRANSQTPRKPLPVHIKIDSGMHRLGFTREQLPQLIELLKSSDLLEPVSVFSHLCVADEPLQDDYTLEQINYFKACADVVQNALGRRLLKHILNTTGIVRFPEHQLDMVRIGVGLYGIRTVGGHAEDALQTVAALRSVIISIKDWPAGTTIGYGRRGKLAKPARIATVAIGYADGLDRHCGNGGISVWAGGKMCPVVGNVCMDACMVDITGTQCRVGDSVEIFGPNADIENVAKARGTIAYEVLTSVSPRVKRIYSTE